MRWAYRLLKWRNDANAIRRAVEAGSTTPIVRRVGRRAYGKLSGKLARRIFG